MHQTSLYLFLIRLIYNQKSVNKFLKCIILLKILILLLVKSFPFSFSKDTSHLEKISLEEENSLISFLQNFYLKYLMHFHYFCHFL